MQVTYMILILIIARQFGHTYLGAAGINLQSTQGFGPGGGHGYDPGDLGEDIRSTRNLPSNASLNTVQNPHPNQGSCN